MSQDFRWAVLLCKCQGTPNNGDSQQFFTEFFTPGLDGGGIEYWSDMSNGQLDISHSSVFSWVELPITTAGILMTRRTDAVEAGINAHRRARHNLDGFDGFLVYIDVPKVGRDVTEGGQAGAGSIGNGKVLIDQGSRYPTFILHEMGHGHGLEHSRGAADDEYGDPYCIMSALTFGGANPTFQDERFGRSGPSLCSPYRIAKGWLSASFIHDIECDGHRPMPTRLSLNPVRRTARPEIQVATIDFTFPYPAKYYISFHTASEWDRGLLQDTIVVRQYRPDRYSYYVGNLIISDRIFVDPKFDLAIDLHGVNNGMPDITIRRARPFGDWQNIDYNPATIALAAYGNDLYQLHNNGRIWKYTGTPMTGWQELDNNPATKAIVAVEGCLYQLHNNGRIWRYTGTPMTGWQELDNNPATVAIAAAGNELYQLHNNGRIWSYTGTPMTGWQELDNNPATKAIVATEGHLYQLHSNGRIWQYKGTPHTGWQELDNNPATVAIVADGSELYQLHNNGRIWRFTGVPHIGWQELDDNPATKAIAASGNRLYQIHDTGKIWRYTGVPHTGWWQIDNNPASVAIYAAGTNLYQLHNNGLIWRYTNS